MENNTSLINAIYRATEGEGVFLGRPQIFVRYQGCAIGCVNCDSKDTWDFKTGMNLNFEEILVKIFKEGRDGLIKNVSITGGDPLHPKHVPHVLELASALKSRHYYINIEAAGTRIVEEIFDLVDYVSFDLKTPSTGVKTPIELIFKMIEKYENKFQLKAVIENKYDFDYTEKVYNELLTKYQKLNFPIVLTPSYNLNEEFPMERFINVMTWNEYIGGPFRVIGQQHKWIFGPDQKEV
jgi:7-carboxy-7-deazaguanine synthase